MSTPEEQITALRKALEKSAEQLRTASRRFSEMGNDPFSAVVLGWYHEARAALGKEAK